MKYPVLKTRSLPNLYKQCATVIVLHIDIVNNGIQENEAFITSYLQYVRNQIYSGVESNFVTSQASKVQAQNDTFVVFKTNTTQKMVVDFIDAMFAELDLYCNQCVSISHQYIKAILYKENAPVNFLKTNKIGEDLLESNTYKHVTKAYKHDKKPRGKQLVSLEEYRTIYDRQPKLSTKKPVQVEEKIERVISSSTDSYEYYI